MLDLLFTMPAKTHAVHGIRIMITYVLQVPIYYLLWLICSQIVALNAAVSFLATNTDYALLIFDQQFDGGAHCYQQITITYGGKTTTATITDEVGNHSINKENYCSTPGANMNVL